MTFAQQIQKEFEEHLNRLEDLYRIHGHIPAPIFIDTKFLIEQTKKSTLLTDIVRLLRDEL